MPTLPPGESSTSGNLALTKFVDNFNNWGAAMNANLDTVDAAVTAVQAAVAAPVPESKVTNLTTDLAAKAPLASPTFTSPASETVTIQGGSSQGAATLLLLKDSTSTHTLKVSDSSGYWTFDGANANGGTVIFKQGIGVYNGGQIANANVGGSILFNSDASLTLLGGNGQQASAVLNAGTIKAATGITLTNSAGDSLIKINSSTGDKGIVIQRDNTGAEYIRLLGCAGGASGQNNVYLFDRIANPNQRPLYFRRSSDGGTTFTNDLVLDAVGNLSVSSGSLTVNAGQIISSVATGTAPLVVTSTTPVANLTLTSAAPSGFGLGTIANRLTTGTDLNTIIHNGWYDVQNAAHSPALFASNWLKLFVTASGDPGNGYVTQEAYDTTGGTNRRFIRNMTSFTWGAWQEMSSVASMIEGTTGSGAIVLASGGVLANPTISGTIASPTISNATLTGTTTAGVLQTNGGGAAGAGTQPMATPLYVQSRGQNLVSNGSGLLGNNYNFASFAFDATDTFSGAGSFKTATVQQGVQNDEFIPVDPTQTYTVSGWGKCGDVGGANFYAGNSQYLGVCPFDIDGQMITPEFYSKFPGATDTTLAATLNVGDTTMTVVNATGWKNSGAANMQWWPYTNSKGYSYPAYTYTRYDSNNLIAAYQTSGMWNTGGVVGNVITLSAPWPGPQLPAGTPVRNGNAGGTYKYIALGGGSIPNVWTNYSGQIGTIDVGGTQNQNQFPYGTAYMRLLFLVNYQGATGGTNNVRWNGLSVGLSPSFTTLNAGTVNASTGINLGTNTSQTTATPLFASFGGTYGTNTPGSAANLKWMLYNDGNPANSYGIGMSAGLMEFRSGAAASMAFFANNGVEAMRIISGGKVGIGTTTPKSALHVVGLPVYANNAAAIAGGLTAGAFYRTGADPDPVCVVH